MDSSFSIFSKITTIFFSSLCLLNYALTKKIPNLNKSRETFWSVNTNFQESEEDKKVQKTLPTLLCAFDNAVDWI